MIIQNVTFLCRLTVLYIDLESGEYIDNHLEKVTLFHFQEKTATITRKSLKHFVESRSRELLKNHTREQVLGFFEFALSNVRDVFENSDTTELCKKNNREVKSKSYAHLGMPSLRIIFDKTEEGIELVSIHFRKHKGT